tara:strand:+ start:4052 stop:4285 length:234 start_codon:yes stop_codon:yes gene_type:complete
MKIKYEQKCNVTCNDNDNTVEADIISFSPEDRLIVAIAGNKIQLNYNRHGRYIGNKVGMEFISEGPKSYEVNMGRQR